MFLRLVVFEIDEDSERELGVPINSRIAQAWRAFRIRGKSRRPDWPIFRKKSRKSETEAGQLDIVSGLLTE